MPDAIIPALVPHGLGTVPGYRIDPATGQEDETWRARFFAWYENARDWRIWAQEKALADATFRDDLTIMCSRDASLFTLMYLKIEEPRSMEYFDTDAEHDIDTALADDDWELDTNFEYQTVHPYLPFSYQVDAHRLLTKVILGPLRSFEYDVLWDKARGIGMSYAFLAWAYWAWLFVPGLRGTILTEKWDKGEKTHSRNTLFGKIDLFHDATPDWLIPAGFRDRGEKDASRQKGTLFNPKTGAAIFTEPTTADSTRGGREAYVGVDEAAFQEYFKDTWATVHGTSKHCIAWSSASWRYGRQWDRAVEAAAKHPRSAKVVTLDRYENPHQDDAWEARTREVFKATGRAEQFEVEYMRNASAGYGTLVYKTQVDMAPITDKGYDRLKPLKLSVDPGVEDATAWVFWQTHFPSSGKKTIRWLDAWEIAKMPVEFHAHVMTGIEPIPGDLCYALWKEGYFEGYVGHIMRFMREVPVENIKLYGDPAMRRRDVTHESWISIFERVTRELRTRAGVTPAHPIMVTLPWEILNKRNNFHDRRVGMREALMMSEFYHSEGAMEFREALESTRFQELTEKTTRPPGHLHDQFSHKVQAGEFGMIWETLKLTPDELKPKQLDGPHKTHKGRKVRSRGQIKSMATQSLVGVG